MLTASYEDPEQLTCGKASRSPALLTDLPGTEQKKKKEGFPQPIYLTRSNLNYMTA